jgi:hypothetical protein
MDNGAHKEGLAHIIVKGMRYLHRYAKSCSTSATSRYPCQPAEPVRFILVRAIDIMEITSVTSASSARPQTSSNESKIRILPSEAIGRDVSRTTADRETSFSHLPCIYLLGAMIGPGSRFTHVRLEMPKVEPLEGMQNSAYYYVTVPSKSSPGRVAQKARECVDKHLDHAQYSLANIRLLYQQTRKGFSSEVDPELCLEEFKISVEAMRTAVRARLAKRIQEMVTVDLTIRQANHQAALSAEDSAIVAGSLRKIISLLQPLWTDDVLKPALTIVTARRRLRDSFLQVVERWKNSWENGPTCAAGSLQRLANYQDYNHASTIEDFAHLVELVTQLLAKMNRNGGSDGITRSLRTLTSNHRLLFREEQKIRKDLRPALCPILNVAVPDLRIRIMRLSESLDASGSASEETTSVYRLTISNGSLEEDIHDSSNAAPSVATFVTEVTLQSDLYQRISDLFSELPGGGNLQPSQWDAMADCVPTIMSESHKGHPLEHTDESIKKEVSVVLRRLTEVLRDRASIIDSYLSDQEYRRTVHYLHAGQA